MAKRRTNSRTNTTEGGATEGQKKMPADGSAPDSASRKRARNAIDDKIMRAPEKSNVSSTTKTTTTKATGYTASKGQEKQTTTAKNYYLMKSEVDVFTIDDLNKMPNQTDMWEGVRNPQARNIMQGMKVSEKAFFWASNTKVPGIVGVMTIAKEAYPDPTQFDPSSTYYDPKSTKEKPRWYCVDVKFEEKFEEPVPLSLLKQHTDSLGHMPLFTMKRLSVQSVPEDCWEYIQTQLRKTA